MSVTIKELAFSNPVEIARAQDALLRRMIELCAIAHPAYRRLWAEQGLDPAEIAGTADLRRLQLTRKEDVSVDPDQFRLDSRHLPLEEGTAWDVMYTTGSTGTPVPFYSTSYDYYNTLALQRRACDIRGITAEDTIANLYPYTPRPHGAFTRCSQAAGVIGARLVVGGGGRSYGPHTVHRSTSEVVELLARTQPTVLWGVVSYLRHLFIAAKEAGVRLEHVRMCAVSGEPLSAAMRADLMQRLAELGSPGAVINDSLGATEMQAGLVECAEGFGLHNPSPELFYFETVDEEGMPAAEGEPGMLALSHLDRRGTVLLRYITGDRVVLAREPCPRCGRAGGRIVSEPRRIGRLVKIRGMLVDSESAILAVEEVAGAVDFEIRLIREDPGDSLSMDQLVVRLFDDTGSVMPEVIAAAVKSRTNIFRQVRVEPTHGSRGDSMKVTRFIDERDSA